MLSFAQNTTLLPTSLCVLLTGKHGWVQYFCKTALREATGLSHKNQQVFIVMNPIDLNMEPAILAVSSQPGKQEGRQTGRLTVTDRLTDGRTDGRADRQTDRQRHRQICRGIGRGERRKDGRMDRRTYVVANGLLLAKMFIA